MMSFDEMAGDIFICKIIVTTLSLLLSVILYNSLMSDTLLKMTIKNTHPPLGGATITIMSAARPPAVKNNKSERLLSNMFSDFRFLDKNQISEGRPVLIVWHYFTCCLHKCSIFTVFFITLLILPL